MAGRSALLVVPIFLALAGCIDPPAAAPRETTGRAGDSAGALKGVSYTTGSPAVLFVQPNAKLAIEVAPDRPLYRAGALPRVTVRTVAAPGATLAYRVADGFGQVLAEKTVPADDATGADIALPPGHGYYEVVARLTAGSRLLGEARRSVGALTPPAKAVGDEPFGLWIQGDENYPELGVRWVRDGVNWDSYRGHGERYLDRRLDRYKWYREHNIRVIAYPKAPPRPYRTSREVIEDTPEAWRALEEWWTTIVRKLAGHVDAWGVINEPMRGHWKGTDALIVRYWALMRKIVNRYDPGTPLIGPSLSPNISTMMAQYQDLLNLGFGKYIDAVEMHTYVTNPEGKLDVNTRRTRDMTRQATGRDFPIWSTEHGYSATYQNELLQAQQLMRSWLEAKRIGYPVMIWHMFSWPQGSDMREVQYSIFRNVRRPGEAAPQPRPAGVAFGVMTRQLAGAVYKRRLDHPDPSVYAYVFERDGKAMVALWTTGAKTHEVALPVGDEKDVTVTGLFGRVERLEPHDGLIRATADRNPKIIASLPAFHLRAEALIKLDKALAVLPGGSAPATLTLTNPTRSPVRLRIEWLASDGWTVALPQTEWSLGAGQSRTVPLTVTASPSLAIGSYQLNAKVFRDGKHVAAFAAQASVLPQVTPADIRPQFAKGRAVIAGTLRRLDPGLFEATIQLAEDSSVRLRVPFNNRDSATFALPVNSRGASRLEPLTLVVRGSQNKVQVQESVKLSFVPADRLKHGPVIDGNLDDWPATGSEDAPSVRWAWDERSLCLAVRVPDRTHMQRQSITEMWKDDSLQIGLAPGRIEQLVRESRPGLQEAENAELDVALGRDGPAMYRRRTMNGQLAPAGAVNQEAIRYAVRHRDGATSYELRIPVEQLGLRQLRAGEVLRASLLINDNDGQGRRTTAWFDGIEEAKDPELFGHLILRD